MGKHKPIAENMALAQEMIVNLRRPARGINIILQLDMSKAFDRVNWSYLLKVLVAYGFSDKWLALIFNCISSNFFSISFSGNTFGYFRSSRGLRQGDPISPLLIILSEEPFSRDLSKLYSIGALKPYTMPKDCQVISHLLYADYVLLFANGEKRNLKKLLNFIKLYENAFRHKLNFAKSKFYVHHSVSDTRKSMMAHVTGFV